MKRVSFYAGRNRSGNLLHVETDGCIVNIRVGLHDADGRQVTSVEILADNYAEEGGRWALDGYVNNRVIQLRDSETKADVGWLAEMRDRISQAVSTPVTPEEGS